MFIFKNKFMQKIGVFFGGKSPEHDISIITGQLIISGLKELAEYKVIPVYLSKKGEWFIGKDLGFIEFFTDSNKEEKLKNLGNFYLDLKKSSGKLVFKKRGLFSGKIEINLAFPAFHGANGEDGTIQGLFEIFNIPYIGCGVVSSAIAMDKVLTKFFYQSQGIPTVEFIYFHKLDWEENKDKILKKIKEKLNWPVIVKPARLGSSIAVVKAKTPEDLEFAIEVALHYDSKVLVERCIENLMDVTCAVLGNDKVKSSFLQESLFKDELFSYEDKYLKQGGSQLGKAKENIIIPARLDSTTTQEIQNLSVKIFKLLGCSGIARVDFLYDKTAKKAYANEINTLPGTLYHHLWEKSGLEFDKLLKELIKLAREKHEERNKIISTFESDILKQGKGGKL